MKVNALVQIAQENQLCKTEIHRKKFHLSEISSQNWNEIYSQWIKSIPNGHGVYIFSTNDQVLYIGLSGKVKNWPISTDWDVKKRLKASRGINGNGIDVSTVNFIKQIVTTGKTEIKRYEGINTGVLEDFQITILYTTEIIPPSYLEALLLYKHLSIGNSLPIFNLSF